VASSERTEKARQRIEAAAADLEHLIEKQEQRSRQAAEKAQADLASLKSENQRLRTLNETVTKRLDATIKRLRGMLDA
jgi:flagellar biosynthesis chaperone FliJ